MMSTSNTIPAAKEQPPLFFSFNPYVTSDGDGHIISGLSDYQGRPLIGQVNNTVGLMKAPAGMHVEGQTNVRDFILTQTNNVSLSLSSLL